MFALLLLIQAGPPTVGDTIWVERMVPVPAGYTVRSAPWQPSGAVELLGAPEVVSATGETRLRYPLVAWEAGSHTVTIPGPLLVAPSGRVDSLPAQSFLVEVASVLPAGKPDSALRAQPAAALIPSGRYSLLPLILLWLLASALMITLVLLWRRRGPRSPLPVPLAASAPPVEQWAAAGEIRAVAALAAAELKGAISNGLPEAHAGLSADQLVEVLARARAAWPLTRLQEAVTELEAARFAPLTSTEVMTLYRESLDLARRIRTEHP